VVLYLCDVGKRDLDDLPVCALDFNARGSEGLSGFHAADDSADAPAVARYNFDVVFAVQRLKGRQRFSNFQDIYPSDKFPPRKICTEADTMSNRG